MILVSGVLNNTGHSVVFTVDEDTEDPGVPGAQGTLTGSMGVPLGGPMGGGMGGTMGGSMGHGLGSQMGVSEEENLFPHPNRRHRNAPLNITGGPLSYRYRIQIYGYNSQLFSNFSDAVSRAHGIVAICIMIQVSTQGNPELRILTDAMEKIRYAGSWAPVERLSVRGLLPSTENYMTYEGSLTQPPCHETVTWVVLNKPIYITKQQLHVLRKLHQGTKASPKAKMVNNFRPIQQMYHRPLRTNIDFTNGRQLNCPSMARQMYYTGRTQLFSLCIAIAGRRSIPALDYPVPFQLDRRLKVKPSSAINVVNMRNKVENAWT
ncbi:carbonic anhydrase-related protein 10-like [Penaeus indicus]|uniref:carbonic anhydrase-related protein 10-like n=1 Tax=Penaeus indicus TaxID=29960 RepID=UPI00300C3902